MMIREPTVAGTFYGHSPEQCAADLNRCLDIADKAAAECATSAADAGAGESGPIGGIVPHAGWICSGAVAGRVFREIAERKAPDVVVFFGAVHVRPCTKAAVFPSGAWETPLGMVEVDTRLTERLMAQTSLLDADPHAHEGEHSIEVQIPFLRHLMPAAKMVPIMVPPDDKAVALGTSVGRTCESYGTNVAFVGSTDLTHYGPSYGFVPQGVGAAGLAWAKDINDQRLIDLILAMRADEIVSEAAANHNACGAGAIAATIAACRAYGATRATLLEHTTSFEVLRELHDEPMRDAVGYASMVFGR